MVNNDKYPIAGSIPANRLVGVWETNPARTLLVAVIFYLQMVAEYPAPPGDSIASASGLLAFLPDWARWKLGFAHNFSGTEDPNWVENSNQDRKYETVIPAYSVSKTWGWKELVSLCPAMTPPLVKSCANNSWDIARYYALGCPVYVCQATPYCAPSPAIDFTDMSTYGVSTGCYIMTGWMQSIARALNVPLYAAEVTKARLGIINSETNQVGFGGGSGHSSPYLPLADIILSHADDVYKNEYDCVGLEGPRKWLDRSVFTKITGEASKEDDNAFLRVVTYYARIRESFFTIGQLPYSLASKDYFCTNKEASPELADNWFPDVVLGTCAATYGGITLKTIDDAVATGLMKSQDGLPVSLVQLRNIAISLGVLSGDEAGGECQEYEDT